MTKAVSNREICFTKAVLLLCKLGHFFSSKFGKNGVNPPPLPQILLGLNRYIYIYTSNLYIVNQSQISLSKPYTNN